MRIQTIFKFFLLATMTGTLSVTLPHSSWSEESPTALPAYTCYKIAEIGDDGWPTMVTWQAMEACGRFVKGEDGSKARQTTRARMGWTPEGLYIRWSCIDSHIWADYLNRDDHLWEEEVVEIFLATSDNPYRYYELEVSPRNLIVDLDIIWPENKSEGTFDGKIEWNANGCRSDVNIRGTLNDPSDKDRSWTVLLFIPFEAIGVKAPPLGDDAKPWRFNLFRIDRHETDGDEYQAWSPPLTDPINFHTPERFGYLRFSEETKRPDAPQRNSAKKPN